MGGEKMVAPEATRVYPTGPRLRASHAPAGGAGHSGAVCHVAAESAHPEAVARRISRTRGGHSMRGKAFVAAGILGLVVLAAGVLPAAGEDSASRVTWRYPVKFVCGDPGSGNPAVPDVQLPLTRGRYHTAINVHNPSVDRPVGFVKKVAVASASPYEGAQRPGKVTPFVQ